MIAPRHAGRTLMVLLLAALVLAPLTFDLWLIARYSVDVPVGDEWWVGIQLTKVASGEMDFHQLLAQANESRPAVPFLAFLALARMTAWNTRAEMLLSQALLLFTAAGIVWLARRTLRASWATCLALGFLSALLLFSPVQQDNLLWGIQAIVFFPAACLVGCLIVAETVWPLWVRTAVQIGLSVIATYSYANGMSLWAIVPWLSARDWRRAAPRVRAALVVAWVMAAGVSLGRYFSGYDKPPQHPSLALAFERPGAALASFVLYLGSPLSHGPRIETLTLALTAGLSALVILALCVLWLAVSSRGREVAGRAFPWLALVAYSMAAGAAIVAGRLGFSIEYSLQSRYVAFSACFYVGLFHLVALVVQEVPRPFARWLKNAAIVCALGVVWLHAQAVATVFPTYAQLRTRRLQSAAALWLLPQLPYAQLMDRVSPGLTGTTALRIAEQLDRQGWIRTGLLRDFGTAVRTGGRASEFGWFDQTTLTGQSYIASGWCVLKSRREPCDAVVLTAGGSSGGEQACAVLFPDRPRADAARAVGLGAEQLYGWAGIITCPRTAALRAWAIDIETRTVHALADARATATGDHR